MNINITNMHTELEFIRTSVFQSPLYCLDSTQLAELPR